MTFLRKVMPAPLTSAALFVLWVALARAANPGHILLGLALALIVPLVTANLRLGSAHVRRPLVVMRFILTVGGDVLLSNVEVGWGVVAGRWRRSRSGFVTVPLQLRDPVGLAVLAMVTTIVPGTVWSEIALDRSAMLLHVWDIDEEGAFVARFKARYEKPLREIFE